MDNTDISQILNYIPSFAKILFGSSMFIAIISWLLNQWSQNKTAKLERNKPIGTIIFTLFKYYKILLLIQIREELKKQTKPIKDDNSLKNAILHLLKEVDLPAPEIEQNEYAYLLKSISEFDPILAIKLTPCLDNTDFYFKIANGFEKFKKTYLEIRPNLIESNKTDLELVCNLENLAKGFNPYIQKFIDSQNNIIEIEKALKSLSWKFGIVNYIKMKFTLRFLKKFKNKILNPNVRNKEFDKIENIITKILKEFEEKKKEAQLNIKTNL